MIVTPRLADSSGLLKNTNGTERMSERGVFYQAHCTTQSQVGIEITGGRQRPRPRPAAALT
jgi:hypothetical protein